MSREARGLELKVGLFVFTGLAVIAGMVVKFGLIGQGLSDFYPLTLEFQNASGIVQGSDVLLAGARIGYVEERPTVLQEKLAVTIPVRIRQDVRIPREVRFQVGSSGLLGDAFIDVVPTSEFDRATYDPANTEQTLAPGTYIAGSAPAGGMNEIMAKGGDAVDALKAELERIGEAVERIKTGVLSDENMENLKVTFANLKTSSERLSQATAGIEKVVASAQGVVETAGTTMESANTTMLTANEAANDLRKAIEDARAALAEVQTALQKANTGDGLLPTLLTDKKLSEDLRALTLNLRRHGVLFYKDSAIPTRRAEPSR